MKAFPDSLACSSRAHCYACRNDSAFRAQLEAHFGPVTCPLALPIGAPVEDMPELTPAPPSGQPCRDCNF